MIRVIVRALGALVVLTGVAAADPVSLFVVADGQPIKGEPSVISLGRQDSIECRSVATTVVRIDEGQGAARGPLRGGQLSCVKAIDKASPALVRALVGGASTEVTAKFYRPNPMGDGTTEQFYTIAGRGRVVSVEQTGSTTAGQTALETVVFDFDLMTFTFTNGGSTAKARF